MEWFTKVNILPNWAWLVIALLVVILIVVLIVATIKLKKKEEIKAENAQDEQPAKLQSQAEMQEVAVTQSQESDENEKSDETKKEQSAAKQNDKKRVYHISRNKEDNTWKVKAEGAARTLKLFKTQAEAIEYAKVLIDNNPEARIIIHKEDGSFRRLTYKSKQ